jgi:hypothetical protein
MANKPEIKAVKNLVTPKGRVSYPKLVAPDTKGEYADDKYKFVLLMPKQGSDLKTLKEAVLKCAKDNFGPTHANLATLLHPFRDGDAADVGKKGPEYKGCIFLNLKTTQRPRYLDSAKQDLDPKEIYGGCWARAVVTAWPYKQAGKCGVTFLLNAVQKLDDGDRFGGGGFDMDALDDVEAPATEAEEAPNGGDADDFLK